MKEYTYIDLTQNDVYYAANNDEEVKNIPRITKVTLHRRGGVGWQGREGKRGRLDRFQTGDEGWSTTGLIPETSAPHRD